MDDITKQYDNSVERISKASATILQWQINNAAAFATVLKRDFEFEPTEAATNMMEVLSSMVDRWRKGGIPCRDQNGNKRLSPPMGEVVLAEALCGSFGQALAQKAANDVYRKAETLVLKARRKASQKLDDTILQYEQGQRNANLYDHPELEVKEERTTDPMTEIARHEKQLAKYPAKPGKK